MQPGVSSGHGGGAGNVLRPPIALLVRLDGTDAQRVSPSVTTSPRSSLVQHRRRDVDASARASRCKDDCLRTGRFRLNRSEGLPQPLRS
jgi:hypothetical protein